MEKDMQTCGKPIEAYVTIHGDTYRVNKLLSMVTHKSNVELWVMGTTGPKVFYIKHDKLMFHTMEDLVDWGWITPTVRCIVDPATVVFWHKNRKYMQKLECFGAKNIILRRQTQTDQKKMELHWTHGQIESVAILGDDGVDLMELIDTKPRHGTGECVDVWRVGLKYFTDSGMLMDVTKG
jgi:hypothetical protein